MFVCLIFVNCEKKKDKSKEDLFKESDFFEKSKDMPKEIEKKSSINKIYKEVQPKKEKKQFYASMPSIKKEDKDEEEDLSQILEKDENQEEQEEDKSIAGFSKLSTETCGEIDSEISVIDLIQPNILSRGMEVNISGTADLDTKKWKLKNPTRIVLDIKQACIKNVNKTISVPSNDLISQITLAQYVSESKKYLARITVYLKQEVQFKLDESGSSLKLLVK
jgi:hypothetical protein